MTTSWPCAGKGVEAFRLLLLERATLPPRNPRSISVGRFAAAFAQRSTSLRIADVFPFEYWISVATRTFARKERSSFQRLEFSMGLPSRLSHFCFFQYAARR